MKQKEREKADIESRDIERGYNYTKK